MADRYTLSTTEIAQLVGVSVPTVTAALDRGAPCLKRGSRGRPARIDARAFVQWWVADQVAAARRAAAPAGGDESLAVQRERLELRKLELDVAAKEGTLIDRATAEAEREHVMRVVAAALEETPTREAHRVVGLADEPAALVALTAVIDGLRDELTRAATWLDDGGAATEDDAA